MSLWWQPAETKTSRGTLLLQKFKNIPGMCLNRTEPTPGTENENIQNTRAHKMHTPAAALEKPGLMASRAGVDRETWCLAPKARLNQVGMRMRGRCSCSWERFRNGLKIASFLHFATITGASQEIVKLLWLENIKSTQKVRVTRRWTLETGRKSTP